METGCVAAGRRKADETLKVQGRGISEGSWAIILGCAWEREIVCINRVSPGLQAWHCLGSRAGHKTKETWEASGVLLERKLEIP